MARTRSRHVGRSVVSGATTPNRNGLVMPGLLAHGRISGLSPVKRRAVTLPPTLQTPPSPRTHRCLDNRPPLTPQRAGCVRETLLMNGKQCRFRVAQTDQADEVLD